MATHTINYYLYVNEHPFTSNNRTDVTQYVDDIGKLRTYIDYGDPNTLWNGGALRVTFRNWDDVLFDDTSYGSASGVIPFYIRELYLEIEVDSTRFWIGYIDSPMDFRYDNEMLTIDFNALFNKAVTSSNICGDFQVNSSTAAVTKTGVGYNRINLQRLLDHIAFDRLQVMDTSYDVRYSDYSQTDDKAYDFGDLYFMAGNKREDINGMSVTEFLKSIGVMFTAFPMVAYPSGTPTFYMKDRQSTTSVRTMTTAELRGRLIKMTRQEQAKPVSLSTIVEFPGGQSLRYFQGTYGFDISSFFSWADVNTNGSLNDTTLVIKNMFGGDSFSSLNVVPKGLKFMIYNDDTDFQETIYMVKNGQAFAGIGGSSPDATTIDIIPALSAGVSANDQVVFDWPLEELLEYADKKFRPGDKNKRGPSTSSGDYRPYGGRSPAIKTKDKNRIFQDPIGFNQDISILGQCIFVEFDNGKFFVSDTTDLKTVDADASSPSWSTKTSSVTGYAAGVFFLPITPSNIFATTDLGITINTNNTFPLQYVYKLTQDGPMLVRCRANVTTDSLGIQEKIINDKWQLVDGDDSDSQSVGGGASLESIFITHEDSEIDSPFYAWYALDGTASDTVQMRLVEYDENGPNVNGSADLDLTLTNGDNPRQIYVDHFDYDHYTVYAACLGAQIIKRYHKGGAWADLVSSSGSSTAIAAGVTGTSVDQTDYKSVWKTRTQAFLDTKGWPFYTTTANAEATSTTKMKRTFDCDDIFQQYCRIHVKINNESFEYECTNSTRSTQMTGIVNAINNNQSPNLEVTASAKTDGFSLEADNNDEPFVFFVDIRVWMGQVWFMYEDPVGGNHTIWYLDEFSGNIGTDIAAGNLTDSTFLFGQTVNNKLVNLGDKPLALWGTVGRDVQFDLDELVTDVVLGDAITIPKEVTAYNGDAADGTFNVGEMEFDFNEQKTTIKAYENNTVT